MNSRKQKDKIFSESPLLKFSFYTDMQTEIILSLGDDIAKMLDKVLEIEPYNGRDINKIYGMFWLWVIDAFEITRTMYQKRTCFSEDLVTKLKALKENILLLRAPFTKQEYPGKGIPIESEASIRAFDKKERNLKFKINGKVLSMRELINEFDSVFSNIRLDDILCAHRESYSKKL